MNAINDNTIARSSASSAVYRDPPRPLFRLYVPITAALIVAVSSFATLAAYDKPLDRQALTPSVMEFMDVNSVETQKANVSAPQDELPKAHAVLLRYDFLAYREAGSQSSWQPVSMVSAQPALL